MKENHHLFAFIGLFLLVVAAHAQQTKLVLPTGHTDHIRSCLFSPDSKHVVTGSADGTSKIWEVSSGRLLHTLQGVGAFYSADGGLLFTTVDWKSTHVWDAKTGAQLHRLNGTDAQLLSDGKSIATIHGTTIDVFYKNNPITVELNSCKIWDVATGEMRLALSMNEGDGTPYIYPSPTGKHIVTLVDHEGTESEFKLYSLETGKLVYEETGIYFRSFSPDGRYIAIHTSYLYSKQETWRIKIFELVDDSLQLRLDGPDVVQYRSDGKWLVTTTGSSYSILDANSFKPIFESKGDTAESDGINQLIFSPDNRYLFIKRGLRLERLSMDPFQKQNIESELITVPNKPSDYTSVDLYFPKQINQLLLVKEGMRPELWQVDEVRKLGTFDVTAASYKHPPLFHPNGKDVFLERRTDYGDYEPDKPKPMWHIWSLENQEALHAFPNTLFSFSPDGRFAAIAADPLTDESSKKTYGFQVLIREIGTGRDKPLIGVTSTAKDIAFHSSGNFFKVRLSKDQYSGRGTDLLFEIASGKSIFRTSRSIQFHPQEEWFAVEQENKIEIRNNNSADTVKTIDMLGFDAWGFNPQGQVYFWDTELTYSPDGQFVTYARDDGEAVVEVIQTDREDVLFGLRPEVQSLGGASLEMAFSADNKVLVTYSTLDSKVYLTQMKTAKSKLLSYEKWINSVTISPDNTHLLINTYGASELINFAKFERLKKVNNTGTPIFSPHGDQLYVTQSEGVVVYPIPQGKGRLLPMAGYALQDLNFTTGKGIASLGPDLLLFDIGTGETILNVILVDSANWVVTHPSGLFDATPGAMDKLYFVAGMEPIELSQLKARYYEPGLWNKVMSGEKLRNVIGFNDVSLPPEIKLSAVDTQGLMRVDVINRGGGIGEITLYINGKEAIRDLRPAGTDPNAATLSLTVPVAGHKGLIAGRENFLAVKAWNSEQWIESRGVAVGYKAPVKSAIKPAIHIIVCGVSDYTGAEIDLKYAAKDAEDMANALSIASKRLFGTDKSIIHSLTTNQPQSLPTKANILQAFAKVAATASVDDVVVLYLSGHGINVGGAEGDFYYLTQEAYTATPSAYNDPAIRQQTTLSSGELVELFKTIPALKQVMIIDACASGRVVENLMVKRDIESGTLRALDRMKDRTGMHIITGCAADAVSYEAGRYGQGVLTYSLLEGMRGLALREDKYADVVKLFQYARDRVPVLASGIGGIQQPQVFSPQGSQSFDIGELTTDDKLKIPLAPAKQIFIRSNFIDELKFKDALGLGKKLDEALNGLAARGNDAPLLFVDVSEYPDACQLSGLYRQSGDVLTMKLNMTCAGTEKSYQLSGANENELIQQILDVIINN